MTNPLLDFSDLPCVSTSIRPEHVAPAMDDAAGERRRARWRPSPRPISLPKWTPIATVLDVATERLGRAWGAVATSTAWPTRPSCAPPSTPCCRRSPSSGPAWAPTSACLPNTRPSTRHSLNAEQRQAHRNALRNFVLGGAELQGAAKERFAQIQERQAELAQKFSENALDATDAFSYYATPKNWTACPPTCSSRPAAAQAEGKDGYKLTLKMPCYLPVMQFATQQRPAPKLYRAYVTRASDQAEGDGRKYDNSA
jgi:oligopeptidase A